MRLLQPARSRILLVLSRVVVALLATSAMAMPLPAQLANECGAPKSGWIFCDDFETDRLNRYFEYVSDSGSFVRARGAGRDSSFGMRALGVWTGSGWALAPRDWEDAAAIHAVG